MPGAIPTAQRRNGIREMGSACWRVRSLGSSQQPRSRSDIQAIPVGQRNRASLHLWGHPGKMQSPDSYLRPNGDFANAINLAAITGGPADIAAVRQYQSRGGVSMNIEQEITSDLGAFLRAGWADGNKEPYEFTDIDRTVAGGVSVAGKLWARPDDTMGLAGVLNGISWGASGLPQCRWPGHPGRRWTIATSRIRANHRGLLQLCVDPARGCPWIISLSPTWLQYRSRASECFCWPIPHRILIDIIRPGYLDSRLSMSKSLCG